MATLRAAPYNLVYGNSILARVQSHNERGWSGYSADSTTFATIQTEPVAMTAPARGSTTSETQIEVTWTALTTLSDRGGATILSYNL
jgi:hypothetical protein